MGLFIKDPEWAQGSYHVVFTGEFGGQSNMAFMCSKKGKVIINCKENTSVSWFSGAPHFSENGGPLQSQSISFTEHGRASLKEGDLGVIFPHLLSSFRCKTIFHLTVVYYICTACVTCIVCMYCVHLLFVCGYLCSVSSGPFKRNFFNLARSSHLSWAVVNMLLTFDVIFNGGGRAGGFCELLETWMALVWIWTNWSMDKVLIGELRVKDTVMDIWEVEKTKGEWRDAGHCCIRH